MAVSPARCSRWVYHLGRVRSESAAVAAESSRLRRRSPPRSCAGRTGLAPGTGHLWAVWEADDAALLSAQARNTPVSRISVSERADRAGWRPALSAGAWGEPGCGDHRLVAGTTDSSGERYKPAGVRRIACPGRGGAAVTCPTGRACPLCGRTGATPFFTGRPGESVSR